MIALSFRDLLNRVRGTAGLLRLLQPFGSADRHGALSARAAIIDTPRLDAAEMQLVRLKKSFNRSQRRELKI